jgi:hypothetical protein
MFITRSSAEDMIMTAGEMAYLGLVIGGFLLFAVVLGWVSSSRSSRTLRHTTATADSHFRARSA